MEDLTGTEQIIAQCRGEFPFPMLIKEKPPHILSYKFAARQRQSQWKRTPDLSQVNRDRSDGGQCFPLQGDIIGSGTFLEDTSPLPKKKQKKDADITGADRYLK